MSYHKTIYHFIFGTRNRERTIYEEYEKELYAYTVGIVKNLGGKVYQIGGMPDHIHIVTEIPPKLAIADVAKTIKQSTSVWMKDDSRFSKWNGWAVGYGVFTCSSRDIDRVCSYVRNQKEHHKKVSFLDEYRNILSLAGIEYIEDPA